MVSVLDPEKDILVDYFEFEFEFHDTLKLCQRKVDLLLQKRQSNQLFFLHNNVMLWGHWFLHWQRALSSAACTNTITTKTPAPQEMARLLALITGYDTYENWWNAFNPSKQDQKWVSLQILPSSGSFPTLRHLIIMGPEKVIASSHPTDD